MTAVNTYATLAEYKAFVTARGQSVSTDANDDVVIDNLLEQASRYLDSKTSRWFYPRIDTRYYSIPDSNRLDLDTDLLEVITFLNGDDTSIASTEYNALPRNYSPKYALELTDITSVGWESDSSGGVEYVLDLTGIWGFHDRYVDGWTIAGTLGSAISDTTTKSFTMTAGHTCAVGEILKVDNEILIPATVVTNTVTAIARGDNGSTAATHSNGATVYVWQPMEEARQACLELAMRAYKRRFGQSGGNTETITAAGIVLVPKDVPTLVNDFINVYKRLV